MPLILILDTATKSCSVALIENGKVLESIDFYDGNVFNNWENNLLVTSLKFETLYRLTIEQNEVIDQEIIYNAGSRIRDVETGPDGYIYLALEDPGRIIRFISE